VESEGDGAFFVYKEGVRVGGFDATATYYFTDSVLVGGSYQFNVEHSNGNLYITDFKKIKGILTESYGKPIHDGEH